MQKLITFLILFTHFLIFSQKETNFNEIKNIREDIKPNRNVKLSDTLKLRKWNELDEDRKERIKKSILERQQEIVKDSSKISKILYYGKPENLKLLLGNKVLIDTLINNISRKYFYMIDDTSTDEATYEIVSIERNQGIKDIQLYLKDSKRIAKLKIDTSYSEIYIHVSLASKYSQLKNQETAKKPISGTYELGIKPESIDFLENDFDQLTLHHRIPIKRHYW